MTSYPEVTLKHALEHGLTEHEFQTILDLLGRVPSYVELGLYSVMWSEHCSYKNSILELKRLPRTGPRVMVEAGEENAGVLDIGDGLCVVFKIESHNHPSAVEPYQGAATGVGGILRDVFTMGARPIACLNSLRFGPLTEKRNRALLRGVVKGIADYGNCFGVPTVGGEIYFDESYSGNPLVNAMAVGIVEKGKMARASASGQGNTVMVVGAATGRDGIHGATFASEDLSDKSKEKRPSVQIGDPFKEKLLLEATLELVASGALVGIQDMGAAGVACSCSETAARGETGIDINIDKVSRRENGMNAYEVCLSESQERMLAIIARGKERVAQSIFDKWDLHADVVGSVTAGDRFVVRERGEIVADVPASSLVLGGGAPRNERPFRKPSYLESVQTLDMAALPEADDYTSCLLKLLSSPNIASKRWIYEQYDHTIGTNTKVGCGRSDAAIVRVPGTKKGLAISVDCNGRKVWLDPRDGAALAVFEAARNVACSGARPIGITNCLNFGNPMNPENYYFFHESISGMTAACTALNIPVTGGNVSFYNETAGRPVYPTPTIGMVGLLENVEQSVSMEFVDEGDFIALLGAFRPSIAGSEFLMSMHGLAAGRPAYDGYAETRLITLLPKLAEERLLQSAHDLSDGGLAVALAESCIASNLGCVLTFPWEGRVTDTLFGECSGCAVVSVKHEKWARLVALAALEDVPVQILGRVGGKSLVINDWVAAGVEELERVYESAIPGQMEELA